MISNLGIKETLELLDNLRAAVTSFTEKERALSRDFGARSAAERRDTAELTREVEGELAVALTEADSEKESALLRAQSRYAARKPGIGSAHRSSKQKLLAKIDSDEGHRKYELQKQMMDAERVYPESWERTDAEFEDFRRDLADIDRALGKLRKDCRRAFRGYPYLLRSTGEGPGGERTEHSPDECALRNALKEEMQRISDRLSVFKLQPVPATFRILPPWLMMALFLAAGTTAGFTMHNREIAHAAYFGAAIAAALFAGAVALNIRGRPGAQEAAPGIAAHLYEALRLFKACDEVSARNHEQQLRLIDASCNNKFDTLEDQWDSISDSAETLRLAARDRLDRKAVRAAEKNERLYLLTQERIEKEHADTVAGLKKKAEARKEELTEACNRTIAELRAVNEDTWKALAEAWRHRTEPIYAKLTATDRAARESFPDWNEDAFSAWEPPTTFARAAKFAHLDVDLKQLCGDLPDDKRLAFPGADHFRVPLCLTFPDQGSVLFETWNFGREQAIATLNTIVLRLLATASPSKLSFTIVDPVELGQNFAGIMHLADYEEALVNSRIWTQPAHIEQRLSDLNEHMEKVIQMYLRNEYETITEYNEQAGEIAEKYHFLVVADFPANFTDIAARRLLSIAASGARCGVYTLIHWDHRRSVPQDLVPDELRKGSVCFSGRQNTFTLSDKILKGVALGLDSPPGPDLATRFLHRVGEASVDSGHVEVPFSHVAPADSDLWSTETSDELRIPIGRTGATKLLHLALGKGTRQHALIAGKTGSGKSTLFHVLITNLSLWCSPEQVEFYLVDFKKGVEFKCYASKHLPHAKVIAIESDREFGMSVLQRVDDELRRRGDMFRELGVQDIAGYKRAGGTEPVPRTLLIVDEFQEFFVEDDRISQNAALLLDRIVRQGRAFGIHVLLGSQTLGGAYTLARTTLGQMVIRIALQCNEADSYLIMDDNNPAPRLLSRPGEAIYNDSAGMIEGNSPFQVVWLPDEVRDSYLDKVGALAAARPGLYRGPLIFEGNAPADVRDNELLAELIKTRPSKRPEAARVWLGAPNSIKGPTEATFLRQSGHNLLVVGQREESALATMVVSMISLAAQHPLGTARFVLFDGTAHGSPQKELIGEVIESMRHEVTVVSNSDTAPVMESIAADMAARENDPARAAMSTFILILGLQKFKRLRFEEDFSFSMDDNDSPKNPGRDLNDIICDGASNGIHVIATCDTCNNINRFMSRKALSEFEMRVLFQMSANDSAILIDSPRASGLGLHRAIFYNEHEGYTEVFRPYALPGKDWIDEVSAEV